MALALRAAHDGGDADRRRAGQVAARFGDHAHALGQPGKRVADGRAVAADVGRGFGIVDRKAAADIECIAGTEPLAARRGQESGADFDGLDMLGGIRGLRTDVERDALHLDALPGGQPRQLQRVLRVATELPRQVADRARMTKRHAQQQRGAPGIGTELAHLVGIIGDKGADAVLERVMDIALALDRMRMNAARRIDIEAGGELHLARGRHVQPTALVDDRAHHRRMRQRLERVMQVDARQRLAELAVLHAHPFAVDDQQRRAELGHQAPDLLRLEWINETLAAQGTSPGSSAVPAAARVSRSRTASQRSSAGISWTSRQAAPALSSVRR